MYGIDLERLATFRNERPVARLNSRARTLLNTQTVNNEITLRVSG